MNSLYTKTVLVSSVVSDIKNGDTYNLELSIQRRSKIWNRKSMSLFIDSILRDYPIYPALVNHNTETELDDVIDFKQRFETIYAFANDEFPLAKDLDEFWYKNHRYEIAGKKYSELDEEVQKKFMGRELIIYKLTDADDDEISEIFDRINAGSPLCNGHKRSTIECVELRTALHNLSESEFFDRMLSRAQYKKNYDKDSMLEALMLYYDTEDYPLTSFKNNDINKFVLFLNEKIGNKETCDSVMELLGYMAKALELLSAIFTQDFIEDNSVHTKASSLPLIIYSALDVLKSGKDIATFKEKMENFVLNDENKDEYTKFCKNATANASNVRGRLDYFKNNVLN